MDDWNYKQIRFYLNNWVYGGPLIEYIYSSIRDDVNAHERVSDYITWDKTSNIKLLLQVIPGDIVRNIKNIP